MGIRFHRSVRIAKGLRLNISKRGLGVSVGPRGAKISFGPSGVYSNVGIPGTGLYSRNKLSATSNKKTSKHSISTSINKVTLNLDITISIDEDTGIEIVTIFDRGRQIKDASILRKIKSDPSFKGKIKKVREKTCDQITEKTEILVNIQKHSLTIPNWKNIFDDSKNKRPELYVKKDFNIEKPQRYEIIEQLKFEANSKVHPFFNRSKKRKEYINLRVDKYMEKAISKWKGEKNKFENQEIALEEKINDEKKIEFNNWKKDFNQTYYPTAEFLTKTLSDYLTEIRIPVDFSVDFDILENGKQIYLDIDLPEIEDYPQKKAKILSTGKVSIKDKSKKEKRFDYLRSISGMSTYFASMVFSISPVIDEVIVSGYTQRLDKSTGNIEDIYLYSVKYDFKQFCKLNIKKLEPELTIKSFESRIKTTAQYEIRTITPFEV